MKKILPLLMITTFYFYSITPAHSTEQVPDGNDVLRDCSLALDMAQDDYIQNVLKGIKQMPSTEQQSKAHQCMGYIVGFKDALYVNQIYEEKNGIKSSICLPYNNLNNELAVRVVLKYIKDNPKLMSRPREGLVFNAFYYAFPCGK